MRQVAQLCVFVSDWRDCVFVVSKYDKKKNTVSWRHTKLIQLISINSRQVQPTHSPRFLIENRQATSEWGWTYKHVFGRILRSTERLLLIITMKNDIDASPFPPRSHASRLKVDNALREQVQSRSELHAQGIKRRFMGESYLSKFTLLVLKRVL